MSRLLTQDEVDALLASFESEETVSEAPGELHYDLRAPILLAGERLAMVLAACDKLASHIADAVTLLMATDRAVRATFTGMVQQPASTVLSTLAQTEPVGVILDEHGEAAGGISFQTELGLAIVDRFLGGDGAVRESQRRLSAVETKLLGQALARVVRQLDHHTPLAPVTPGNLETDPVFGKLVSRGGSLATAMFRLSTPVGEAVCRLMMTPVLANRLLVEETLHREGDTPAELERAVDLVPVSMQPVVTGASLRAGDLHRLCPGHVIQLDVREFDPIGLRLNGRLLVRGGIRSREGERVFEIGGFVERPDGTGSEIDIE
ncbi:MAG: FliM/FliN family flagellar motor switch protein [Acidobacteriota bacterium]|nr:MAG: FliM/FliN family flagellar motor switch protein [Acidobacteriota bacterium]